MYRIAEQEVMDLPEEVAAYAKADFGRANRDFVERLCKTAAAFDRADVLDLGCGPGDIAVRVARARPRWRITGLDASQPMLDWAAKFIEKQKLDDRVTLRIGDAKKLNIARESFDVVFSNSLLHHLSEPVAFWEEMLRVARPRAAFFVRDLVRPPDELVAKALVEMHTAGESEILKQEFHRSLLSAYSIDEIKKQIDTIGVTFLDAQLVGDRYVEISGVR